MKLESPPDMNTGSLSPVSPPRSLAERFEEHYPSMATLKRRGQKRPARIVLKMKPESQERDLKSVFID